MASKERKSTDRFTYGDLTEIPEIAYGYGVGDGTIEAQTKTKTQTQPQRKGQSDTKLERRVRRLESDMRGVTTLIHNQNKVIEDMDGKLEGLMNNHTSWF